MSYVEDLKMHGSTMVLAGQSRRAVQQRKRAGCVTTGLFNRETRN